MITVMNTQDDLKHSARSLRKKEVLSMRSQQTPKLLVKYIMNRRERKIIMYDPPAL
jgi:hypothetical protein